MLISRIGFILAVTLCNVFASAQSNSVQLKSYEELEKTISTDTSGIIILNFWATWCKPCIEELPDFEKVYAETGNKTVKLILGNLDFHSKVESSVVPFVEKWKLTGTVVHITDTDPNSWIDKADKEWSGAIPATIIFYKGKKVWFHEGKTDYETLKSIISKYITP